MTATPCRPAAQRPGKHARRAVAVTLLAAMSLAAGCATLIGRHVDPLATRRAEPHVELCLSERLSGGGMRLLGRMEPGKYRVTNVRLEYRIASPSSAPPVEDAGGRRLRLLSPRTAKVEWRAERGEVVFGVEGDAARSLAGKVLWYRWVVEYDRDGSPRQEATSVHRASLDEAGLPRDPFSPGPDSSIAPPSY